LGIKPSSVLPLLPLLVALSLSSPVPPLLASSYDVATSTLSPPLSQLLSLHHEGSMDAGSGEEAPARPSWRGGGLADGRSRWCGALVPGSPVDAASPDGPAWCGAPVPGVNTRPPPNCREPRGRRDQRTPAGDEWRIQTGLGLRPVHHRFVLSICLLAVGFGAVAG
jgi:hypothetical protein